MLATVRAEAQTVGNLRLKRDYRGRLDIILEEIASEMRIRFVYDSTHLSRYNTHLTTYEEKTINGILRLFRKSWDMATAINDDGYIYIARDETHLAELMELRVEQEQETIGEMITERSRLEPVKKNFTLTGEISDVDNGERIPYATVIVDGTTNGSTSDANGRFTLENVPADTCVLIVSYLGYRTRFIQLEPSTENGTYYIELEQQKHEIAEVFVYGRKEDKALEQSVGEHKIKMSPAALKFLPNIGEKDILRSFQLMPGVSASNENSSGMYVRGGTPDQNLIVYDGFTVYYVDHLYGFYSAFNSNAIKDVQLYKGGFESKFGGRLSSVTEITGKDGNSKKWAVGGEVSLLSVNLYGELPIADKVTTMVAFRRSYQGWLYNRISGQNKSGTEDGEITTSSGPMGVGGRGAEDPASYFYDINAKVTWNVSRKDILSFSVFNATDYLDKTPSFGFAGGGPGGGPFGSLSMQNSDYTKYGNIGVSTRWSRKVNDKLTSTLVASYSNFYSDRDESRAVTYTDDDGNQQDIRSGIIEENDLKDISVHNSWRYSLNDRHLFEAGVFGTYYDIEYSYAQSDTIKIIDNSDKSVIAGLYLQDKIRLDGAKWIVTPGVRATYFSNTSKVYFEPRLSSSYTLAPNITLNGATGLYYQFANRVIREDVMSGNTDFWILSDGKDIPVSRSLHFNLGINYDLPDYLFSIDAYYKKNNNISEYTLRFQRSVGSLMGGGPGSGSQNGITEATEQFFTGNGYATGIEFLTQKKAGKFSGWVSYTIGEVKNRFPEQSDKYYYASQDVTHELKAVAVYKFGNFNFSATWIYSTGRPYTAPLGGYVMTLVDGSQESYYAVSDKNTFRLPNYHRLDLAASFRFDMFGTKGKKQAISVSVFNAYDRKNVSSKKFQIVDDVILESNVNYLSITPNVTLSFNF